MDRSVLLLVFCLQVFLLISTFTFTDAAALTMDPQRPSEQVGRKPIGQYSRTSLCSRRPGACALLGSAPQPTFFLVPFPLPTPPAPPTQSGLPGTPVPPASPTPHTATPSPTQPGLPGTPIPTGLPGSPSSLPLRTPDSDSNQNENLRDGGSQTD